ncbi:MAG: DUF1178 family protein [Pseudomonadota bacterium]
MIRYQLECSDRHRFESWFANSAAYDRQAGAGLIECPVCQSTKVRKAIMAPNVSPRTRQKGAASQQAAPAPTPDAAPGTSLVPVAAPSPAMKVSNTGAPSEAEKVVAFMRAVRAAATANADDVGGKFAEEARKIHYGETEQRAIYGEATAEEAAELLEEEIPFMPLPTLPEDRN